MVGVGTKLEQGETVMWQGGVVWGGESGGGGGNGGNGERWREQRWAVGAEMGGRSETGWRVREQGQSRVGDVAGQGRAAVWEQGGSGGGRQEWRRQRERSWMVRVEADGGWDQCPQHCSEHFSLPGAQAPILLLFFQTVA